VIVQKELDLMGSKPPKPARQLSTGVQWLRIALRPQNRGPILAALVIVAAIAGLTVAWNKWGAPTTKSAEYVVTPDKIDVTPQPAWIHADVKADVVQVGKLTQLNLRDPQLVEEVARAFALHAWVAKVVRVTKEFPARVNVELEYRRPIAAVEITSQGQPGLLFVDAEGVLLPSEDFAQSQAKDFLRIAAGSSTPASVYGAPWGDERIAGAARVAQLWGDRFRQPGLVRMVAVEQPGGQIIYELRTAGETRVIWGPAPGREAAAEPAAEQKIAALLDYIADKGPLDRENGERLVDLRKLAGVRREGEAPAEP
jgi:hypothetical protein